MNPHNEIQQKPKWVKTKKALKFAKYLLLLSTLIGGSFAVVKVCYLVGDYWGVSVAYAKEKFTEVKVIEKVQVLDPEVVPVEELINQLSADAGINPVIIKAMAIQESGGFSKLDRYRYEERLLPLTKDIEGLPDEKKQWAGSWGLLQVIPILHAKRCGFKSYGDFIDPKNNI